MKWFSKITVMFFCFLFFCIDGFSVMVIEETCYQTGVSDGANSHFGQWICVYDLVDDGSGGGNVGGDDDIGGPDGGGPSDATNGQQIADCWRNLTLSDRITCFFAEDRSGGCGFHTGIDIGTAQEAPDGKLNVFSGTSGTVNYIGYQANGAGFYVKVKNDNGSYIVYSHLDGNEATGSFNNVGNLCVGDRISVDDTIGLTDNSGNSSGSHLDVKIYFTGNRSLSYIRSKFGNNDINEYNIQYCSSTDRTYIDPTVVMHSANDC